MAARGPPEGSDACSVAGHAHVLAVGETPAVQHRLLHRGYQKAPVGMHRHAEMRTLPLELLRLGLWRVGEPERRAVVMRDGKPEAFGQEGQSAGGRRCLKGAEFLGLYEYGFASRPGDRAVGAKRDTIDPSSLGIGGKRAALATDISLNDFAVVAARDDG